MAGALDGIRVLDAGLLVQGPQAAALLADMGAEVLKVELPGFGDQARLIPCSVDDPRSAYFTACNRGKRSIAVDLRTPDGAEVFRRLAATADVIISNFKPGTMDEWGLGYEALSELNPKLIWAAGSTFGPIGPDAQREGADLAGQCAGGLISTTGHDGEQPTPVGVTIADHIGSQNLASGVLAALFAREKSGRGQRVEVSLLGGQIWAQAAEYTHYLLTGKLPGRANGGHPLLPTLYRIFETSDGWLGLVGVPPATKDAFFTAMGHPELAIDPRFAGFTIAPDDLQALFDKLANVFRTRTTDEWCVTLRDAGVRYAPVRNYAQAVADPGAWENGYFMAVDEAGGDRVVGTPIRMSGTPLTPAAKAPTLGEHTGEILAELGFDAAAVERLHAAGAVG